MTDLDSRKTYGLLSKTILQVLANDTISEDQIIAFTLHMQWGIIMAHPEPDKIKLAVEIVQREAEKTPADMKQIYTDNKNSFLKIYKQASTPKLDWHTRWSAHCIELFRQEPSIENCVQLFVIVKDCMGLNPSEWFLTITVIHETLLDMN